MLPEKAKPETNQYTVCPDYVIHLCSPIYILISQNKCERLEKEKLQTWITVGAPIWNDIDHESVTVLKLFNKYRNGEERWQR